MHSQTDFSSGGVFASGIKRQLKKLFNLSNFAVSLGKAIFLKRANRASVYLGDYKALTRTIWGHKIFVDTRDLSLTPSILMNGFWEMWVTKVFMENVKEGMTVVEVGSNIGYYTLLACHKVGSKGKVFAFEANPQTFEILFQNMTVNGFLDKVAMVNKAVFDKSGSLKFHKLKRHQGSSSVVEFSKEHLKKYRDEMEVIEVESVTLDEFLEDKKLKIDVIKIDAEGSEPHIFKGMESIIQKHPKLVIICEFTPELVTCSGENPKSFLEEITRNYGFKLKYIDTKSNLRDISINELLAKPSCELFLTK